MQKENSQKRDRLLVEIQAPVARVTLNNPPVNVIDIVMMQQLRQVLDGIEAQPDISTLVLSGSEKCFSAGVDVAAHTPDKVQSMLEHFHAVIRSLIATRKITIAAVHGNCLGGGAELALVCDLVYTTKDARLGFPEIHLGCFPPVAATALSAVIGQKRASELILTGWTISGAEAAEIGLANHAVESNQLATTIDETVQKLSSLSPAAIAITKKAVYAWDSMHFDKGLARAERIYLDELMQTQDAQEGVRAFMEKRNPEWKGR